VYFLLHELDAFPPPPFFSFPLGARSAVVVPCLSSPPIDRLFSRVLCAFFLSWGTHARPVVTLQTAPSSSWSNACAPLPSRRMSFFPSYQDRCVGLPWHCDVCFLFFPSPGLHAASFLRSLSCFFFLSADPAASGFPWTQGACPLPFFPPFGETPLFEGAMSFFSPPPSWTCDSTFRLLPLRSSPFLFVFRYLFFFSSPCRTPPLLLASFLFFSRPIPSVRRTAFLIFFFSWLQSQLPRPTPIFFFFGAVLWK